jgi:DNA-binding IclR family transcriptional regulator
MDQATDTPKDISIQSLEAALDVLERLVACDRGFCGVTELTTHTGLKKNRVWRILATLAKRGYVLQDSRSGLYSLGPGCLVLGEAYRNRLDLRRLAEPLLSDLAEQSGNVAFLYVRFGREAVCTDTKIGRHNIQAVARQGEPIPLHIGAAPKVLLAFLPEPERSEIMNTIPLTPYTARTITRRDALESELRRIREQGYCLAEDDYEFGANAIGAPVHDHQGRAVAALSMTIPGVRYNDESRDQAIRLVCRAAASLSARLGFAGNS